VIPLALPAEAPSLWTFFGRFHPATVHFPIALLSVAAFLETLQLLRKKPSLSPATLPLAVLGAFSALLATLMGWANASGRKVDNVLDAHRWAGVATAAVALVALCFLFRARSAEGRRTLVARASLYAVAILVGLAGHWGGVLVYGPDYYTSALPGATPDPLPPEPSATAKVDFRADIAPIIEKSCFKCHGGAQGKKGGLNLSTKALTLKGGDSGGVIVPAQPKQSSFYTLLLSKDSEERMPKKAKALPPDQIEKIRRWIEQGADWPDGFEFKK
jgi:uncharacterized membrane protein